MKYANSGDGPTFSVIDIGLDGKVAVLEADTGFWAIVDNSSIGEVLSGEVIEKFLEEEQTLKKEMDFFRFGLKPSAVYFNPTEKCNFNCPYCYIPESIRKYGESMAYDKMEEAIEKLLHYFRSHLPEGVKPQLIFHGSEPMISKDDIFRAIDKFEKDFHFGIQTNGSLLEEKDIKFLKEKGVGIGLSLDAHEEEIADSLRHSWSGKGSFRHILKVISLLSDYPAFNVITTVTNENVSLLPQMVDFYGDHGVRMVMFNPVRCTQEGGKKRKPDDEVMARFFCEALDRTQEVRIKKGVKITVVNFANVLAGILGPTTRRLMCDISPCGGGRCFFAVSARGDVFPCSEFIGFPKFSGGNLFTDSIENILKSEPFSAVTGRKVEDIAPCNRCAIRHFCGAPCPAEVNSLGGTLLAPSPYCKFYEEQVRYGFRVIARGEELNYLWDGWSEETEESYNFY